MCEYAQSTLTCSMERVERKDAGDTAMGFLPALARPAAIETSDCSAMPTSMNCSGRASAKGVIEPEPRESEQRTTMSLSSLASSMSTLHTTCLFAVAITDSPSFPLSRPGPSHTGRRP